MGEENARAVLLTPEERARVDGMYLRMATADYYELLGVPRDADRKTLRDAFFELSKQFHPDAFYGKDLGPARARLDEVFRTLSLAYDVLSNKNRRVAYDATLPPVDAPAQQPPGAPAVASPTATAAPSPRRASGITTAGEPRGEAPPPRPAPAPHADPTPSPPDRSGSYRASPAATPPAAPATRPSRTFTVPMSPVTPVEPLPPPAASASQRTRLPTPAPMVPGAGPQDPEATRRAREGLARKLAGGRTLRAGDTGQFRAATAAPGPDEPQAPSSVMTPEGEPPAPAASPAASRLEPPPQPPQAAPPRPRQIEVLDELFAFDPTPEEPARPGTPSAPVSPSAQAAPSAPVSPAAAITAPVPAPASPAAPTPPSAAAPAAAAAKRSGIAPALMGAGVALLVAAGSLVYFAALRPRAGVAPAALAVGPRSMTPAGITPALSAVAAPAEQAGRRAEAARPADGAAGAHPGGALVALQDAGPSAEDEREAPAAPAPGDDSPARPGPDPEATGPRHGRAARRHSGASWSIRR